MRVCARKGGPGRFETFYDNFSTKGISWFLVIMSLILESSLQVLSHFKKFRTVSNRSRGILRCSS